MGLGDIINAITKWATSLIGLLGYPGLGFVMFLENVFPPIPSEIVLPMAGFMTTAAGVAEFKAHTQFTLWGITLVGCLGSVVGAWTFYGLGRLLGEKRTRILIRKVGKYALLKEEDFDRSLQWFNRYKKPVIFFGRLIPIIRSLISIPAGIFEMNPLIFTAFTAVGTAIWSFLLAFAGSILGSYWPAVTNFINKYQIIIEILLVGLILWFVISRIIKLVQKKKTKAKEELEANLKKAEQPAENENKE
jgi:membrane protein DedA with SNARE-associated domain